MEDAKRGVTIARGVGQAFGGRPLTGLQTAASAIGTNLSGINPKVAAEMLRLGSRKLNRTQFRSPMPLELEQYLRMQALKVGADPVLGRGLLGGAASLATPR